jgi:hypothetical protein
VRTWAKLGHGLVNRVCRRKISAGMHKSVARVKARIAMLLVATLVLLATVALLIAVVSGTRSVKRTSREPPAVQFTPTDDPRYAE